MTAADLSSLEIRAEHLTAEVQRLRALPVLKTCGPCRYLVSSPYRVGLFCIREHKPLPSDVEGRPVAPPSWCPLPRVVDPTCVEVDRD